MHRIMTISISVAALAAGLGGSAFAQQAPQSPNMTFFVASSGSGKGADLGGIDAADARCQTLAMAAGAGNKVWRAYLSSTRPRMARSSSSMRGTASARARGRISRAR